MIGLARLLVALETADAPEPVLTRHLRDIPDADRVWTVALLSGQTPRRAIAPAALRALVTEACGLPPWLIDASLAVAGDLSETAAHLLPAPQTPRPPPLAEAMAELAALALLDPPARDAAIRALWADLPPPARVPLNRLLIGGFGAGLGPGPVARALAALTGQDPAPIAARLARSWSPATTAFSDLIRADNSSPRLVPMRPPRSHDPALQTLGQAAGWSATPWHGDLRVQAVVHHGALSLWSPGGDPLTARFPDLASLGALLPDGTQIDGLLMGWDAAIGALLPPASLRARLSGKAPSQRALAVPARLVAVDLLADAGADLRGLPLSDRWARLAALCAPLGTDAPLRLAHMLTADGSGPHHGRSETLLLRRWAAAYAQDPGDDWLLQSPTPHSLRAVLVYLRTDPAGATECTFALRDGPDLVPIARTAPSLTGPDAAALTGWVRAHTQTRFGPVRQVEPTQVFELAFDSVDHSARHKAGLALRGARVLRWDRDADATGIASLADLRALAAG